VAEDSRRQKPRRRKREAQSAQTKSCASAGHAGRPAGALCCPRCGRGVEERKWVFFFGVLDESGANFGSRGIASRSCGGRSRASSSAPDFKSEAMAEAG
jgi:hypothetical protein